MSFRPICKVNLLLFERSTTFVMIPRTVQLRPNVSPERATHSALFPGRFFRRDDGDFRKRYRQIPDEMPMAEAALIGCGVMTGVGAALYTAEVRRLTVAVIGCGGIGLNIIRVAELLAQLKSSR